MIDMIMKMIFKSSAMRMVIANGILKRYHKHNTNHLEGDTYGLFSALN